MADITVARTGESACHVTVEDAGSRTEHDVTVTAADIRRYGPDATVEDLVKASFEFLLEREPKEAILARFALPVIEGYFPDYPGVIRGRL